MTARAATLRALTKLAKAKLMMRRSPGLFLAHAALRRSLRSQHALMRGLPSTVIVVTGGAAVSESHRKAAELVATGSLDVRARLRRHQEVLVHVLTPPLRKTSKVDNPILDEHGRYDVIVVLVHSRSDIPPEMSLIADAIVDMPKPTVEHIHAIRRLLRRTPINDDTARLLVDLEFPLLVAVVCKHRLSDTEALSLLSASSGNSAGVGPRLEELPGYSPVKTWAQAFIVDLDRFRHGKMDWSNMPRGILLYGPPGTGKTMFAQAFARSAALPLISASVSRWQAAGHLGDLLKAMSETFDKARAKQPAIIFIDELDSIGDRSKFSGDHIDYSRQVVNFLLEQIDGAKGRDQILVIGATNFKEAIDPALLRSGRIERHIRINLPNASERAEILRFHLGVENIEIELMDIAADLEGWSGADLDMLAREAKGRGRMNGRGVRIDDLLESLPPVQALSPHQARRVAFHEAGHAIVASVLFPGCRVSVSIRKKLRLVGSRDLAPGWTRYEDDDYDLLPTNSDFENVICRTLAGAAAEELHLGSRSTGFSGSAGSDLDTASAIAARMVASYGLGRRLRFLIESHHMDIGRASRLPADLRDEITQILEEQFARAKTVLSEQSAFLVELVEELLEKEYVGSTDVAAIGAKSMTSGKDSTRSACP
ncbi:AAA family ATPase [Rhizobium ruizarguesonis]|uniref:AAA family ATPase n=1 Tax=Rhizobium ruizarguesonis TaxID=2081791 RepID=UPI0013D760FF|nr:AAA family ATPase [Rhizobium ruizarguesonis]